MPKANDNIVKNTIQMRPNFILPKPAKKIACAGQQINKIEQTKVPYELLKTAKVLVLKRIRVKTIPFTAASRLSSDEFSDSRFIADEAGAIVDDLPTFLPIL